MSYYQRPVGGAGSRRRALGREPPGSGASVTGGGSGRVTASGGNMANGRGGGGAGGGGGGGEKAGLAAARRRRKVSGAIVPASSGPGPGSSAAPTSTTKSTATNTPTTTAAAARGLGSHSHSNNPGGRGRGRAAGGGGVVIKRHQGVFLGGGGTTSNSTPPSISPHYTAVSPRSLAAATKAAASALDLSIDEQQEQEQQQQQQQQRDGSIPVLSRMVPLPKTQHVNQLPLHPVKVAGGGGEEELHAAERAMVAQVGLFRPQRHKGTVASLLRQYSSGSANGSSGSSNISSNHTGLSRNRPSGDSKDVSRANDGVRNNGSRRGSTSSSNSRDSEDRARNEDNTFSLLTAMTSRLTALERHLASRNKVVASRDAEVAQLEKKLAAAEAASAGQQQVKEQLFELQSENVELRTQIAAMERFLNDYGLIWAGYRAGEGTAAAAAAQESELLAAQVASNDLPPQTEEEARQAATRLIWFDSAAFMTAIQSLNQLAGETKVEVVKDGNVSKFSHHSKTHLSLILFKNGIFFRNGPLRPYSMPETQAFVRDVLEGFFPYELKEEYPDGVIFNCEDRSTEMHVPMSGSVFAGRGNRLGGVRGGRGGGGDGGGGGGGGGEEQKSNAEGVVPAVSREQFLSNLPETVISNGKVIAVREGLGSMLRPGDAVKPGQSGAAGRGVTLVETPTLLMMQRRERARIRQKERESASSSSGSGSSGHVGMGSIPDEDGDLQRELLLRPKTPVDVTTLRVKLDQPNSAPLLIKMRWADTVGDLYKYVRRYRQVSGGADAKCRSNFELRSNFPNRAYVDPKQSLKAAGLTPNGNLLVRALPST